MPKKLVIVESPAKARTVGRFLGSEYAVRASIGHVRDLPQRQFGVDIENGFTPHYVIPPKKKDVVKELRSAVGKGARPGGTSCGIATTATLSFCRVSQIAFPLSVPRSSSTGRESMFGVMK